MAHRGCVDYTNLNIPGPKDSFTLAKITQLVDSIGDHGYLTFMDVYFGSNQMPIGAKLGRYNLYHTPKAILFL